jgi:SAM-dependent methyltransferase
MLKLSIKPLRNLLKRYFYWIYGVAKAERDRNEIESLDFNPNARFIDCGCRDGVKTLQLADHIGTHDIIGLDYTFRVLKQANQRGIKGIRCDLNKPLPLASNSADAIFNSNVLEHLVDPYHFVGEAFRVLRPGGYLMTDTPNLASWHNIFALMIGRQPFSGPNLTNIEDAEIGMVREMHRHHQGLPEEGENVDHNEQELSRHIVVVAYRSLVEMMKHWGFVIVNNRGIGYLPFPPFLARILQRIDPAHAHHAAIKAVKPKI